MQLGAFSHVQATSGDPTRVVFIAGTLRFLQPVIFATAAAIAVLPLRGAPTSFLVGLAEGAALLICYELASTLLGPYGERGIVLTTLVALVLAAVGLLAARDRLHLALLAEAQTALDGGKPLTRAPDSRQVCLHSGAAIGEGAALCQVCGTATAALARHPLPRPGAAVPPAEPSA